MATATLSLLAACSGGGADGGSGDRLFADGTPIDGTDLASYIGKSFQVRMSFAEDDATQATVGVTSGTVEIIDVDTIDVTLGDDSPVGPAGTTRFTRDGSAFFINTDGYRINYDDLTVTQFFLTSEESEPTLVTGVFGFVTPESGYPTTFNTLTFDVRSYAWFNLAGDGSSEFAELYGENFAGEKAVDLTVNFDTDAVTGTLFDGDALVNLDGDPDDDDLLAIVLTMDGTLGPNGITGTFTGTASSDIDDDGIDVEALTFTATNTSVNADLFGNTPERISGVFSGDFTLGDGAGLSVSGEGAGFFDAQVD
ncbi:MAG: hypothetical protein KJO30_01935 [Boseongicola sp.]|nr:hypothetical protein [Boseongicola sp.]